MKSPHLFPALAAILGTAALVASGVVYIQSVEQRYIHALAGQVPQLNITSSALQKEAFRQPDLLPVYGSSEISDQPNDYNALKVFHTYPTGFAPFEVAKGGVTSLVIAQIIAAVGADGQGKKVVISFTPLMFYDKMVSRDAYAGFFSPLRANELAFSPELSFATKQAAARRMLEYPDTLTNDPVLRFALEILADDSPLKRTLYYLIWPLGKLQTLILELQDHWRTFIFISTRPDLRPGVRHRSAVIDWSALKAKAEREQEADANNNPYGIANRIWILRRKINYRAYSSAARLAVTRLQQSAEWTDLDILLRILKDLGVQPLIISRPINGTFWGAMGVPPESRQVYYDKLHQMAKRYNVPVVDFHDYESDKYFTTDPLSHTSRKGWVYVDQIMDGFYHGTLR